MPGAGSYTIGVAADESVMVTTHGKESPIRAAFATRAPRTSTCAPRGIIQMLDLPAACLREDRAYGHLRAPRSRVHLEATRQLWH